MAKANFVKKKNLTRVVYSFRELVHYHNVREDGHRHGRHGAENFTSFIAGIRQRKIAGPGMGF